MARPLRSLPGMMPGLTRFDPRNWKGKVATLSPMERRVVLGAGAALGFVLLAALSVGGYFLGSAPRFPSPPYSSPSRLYGRATHLATDAAYDPADLIAELKEEGYSEAADTAADPEGEPRPGGRLAWDGHRI